MHPMSSRAQVDLTAGADERQLHLKKVRVTLLKALSR
jgi:hypothetical protein